MSVKAFPVIDLAATGSNIRRLRMERGLTVRDLQSYFGFEEPRAIYKWQKGESLLLTLFYDRFFCMRQEWEAASAIYFSGTADSVTKAARLAVRRKKRSKNLGTVKIASRL